MSEKWVRLSNGVVELEESVGSIMCSLRRIETENYADLALLAKYRDGTVKKLPAATLAIAANHDLLKPGIEPPAFYDDVNDVIASAVILKADSVKLKSSPLSDDQTNITAPEE